MQNVAHALSISLAHPITSWLEQRQSLLVSLYDLCDHRPFFRKLNSEELQPALREFCGQILDYLSLGHFKIYEKILSEHEPFVPRLIQELKESTHQIMNLNDKHRFQLNIVRLDQDLSRLIEKLAKRFELEDKLISNYLFTMTTRKKGLSSLN